MGTKVKHTEKFVNYNSIDLKAPKWWVLIYNSKDSIEAMAKEKAKPVDQQNTRNIAYHRALIFKRNQELKRFNYLFN